MLSQRSGQVAPRGPLELANGSFDRSDSYEREILSWREAADTEAHRFAEMCPETGRIQTYMQFVQGDHWNTLGTERPPYRSRIAINKVGTARLNHIASSTDTKPDIDIDCEVPQYEGVAKMIDDVLRHEWVANKMDLSLATAIDIDSMAGTAFWKIGAAAPGMMKVMPCGPDTVLPIQPGFTIQDSTAVKYRTYKSLTDVLLKYPTRAKELAGQARSYDFTTSSKYARPPHLDDITWNRLAPGMQKLLGQRVTIAEPLTGHGFFKSVEWQEYWIEDPSINESNNVVTVRDPGTPKDKHNWWYEVQPGQRLYPRKRLVIFAGNSLIYDGPAPYWHGLYPFACLRTNPVFWSFWGLSRYRDLLPVNSAINEVVAGVMDMLKRAINPVMMAKANTVDEESFRKFFYDMPGARMYVRNSTANLATDVRWMETPELPPWILPFLSQVLGVEFDKLAGDLDVMKLGGKEQVPGGDTLEQMRDAQQAPEAVSLPVHRVVPDGRRGPGGGEHHSVLRTEAPDRHSWSKRGIEGTVHRGNRNTVPLRQERRHAVRYAVRLLAQLPAGRETGVNARRSAGPDEGDGDYPVRAGGYLHRETPRDSGDQGSGGGGAVLRHDASRSGAGRRRPQSAPHQGTKERSAGISEINRLRGSDKCASSVSDGRQLWVTWSRTARVFRLAATSLWLLRIAAGRWRVTRRA